MDRRIPEAESVRRGTRNYVRDAVTTGLALTVPILVTAFVLVFALQFLASALDPLVIGLQRSFGLTRASPPRVALQVLAVLLLAGLVFLVGVVAESEIGSGRIERGVDGIIGAIPGIGAVYESLDEMSELLLSRDSDSFREVKLVEYPNEGSYTIAFVTAEPGEAVRRATGHQEMVSLFLPMAPNPFMGGFVIHVSADQVYDVDLTVEEGIQAVVSSGVAIDDRVDDADRDHPEGPPGAPGAPGAPVDPDPGRGGDGGRGSDPGAGPGGRPGGRL